MSSSPPPEGYRPCVGALVLNSAGDVFVGQRAGLAVDDPFSWQCPQGGIDADEEPEAGARRELAEETGITSVRLLTSMNTWLYYDFPPEVLGKRFKSFRGQAQLWFAFAFEGEEAEINLDCDKKPEFQAWKWVPIQTLPALIVPFKRSVYEDMVSAFLPLAVRHRRQGD